MIGGPYGIIAAAIGVAIAVGAAYFTGRSEGRKLERVAWVERDNQAIRDANIALEAAHKAAREKEAALSRSYNEASKRYQEELGRVKTERDRVAGRLATANRVRDATAASVEADRGEGTAPATAGRCDGAAGGELSQSMGKAARELGFAGIELMSEADAVVQQLTACQAALSQP